MWQSKEVDNKYQRNQRQKKIDAGVCVRCKAPALPGRTKCHEHVGYAHSSYRKDFEKTPDKFRKRSQVARFKRRGEVISYYGGCCACCGERQDEFLVIDHVDGQASAYKTVTGKSHSGYRLYLYLVKEKFPSGYRVLCANCNMAMSIHGQCPHGTLPPQITNHPANPHRKEWKKQYQK